MSATSVRYGTCSSADLWSSSLKADRPYALLAEACLAGDSAHIHLREVAEPKLEADRFFWDDFVTENAYSVEASFGMVYSRFAKEGPFSNRAFRFRLHAPQTARPMATAHRDLARVGLARTAQAVFNLAI